MKHVKITKRELGVALGAAGFVLLVITGTGVNFLIHPNKTLDNQIIGWFMTILGVVTAVMLVLAELDIHTVKDDE